MPIKHEGIMKSDGLCNGRATVHVTIWENLSGSTFHN